MTLPISVVLVTWNSASVVRASMEAWELAVREAIRHTIASYTYFNDRGRFDDAAACFATDGVLEVIGIGIVDHKVFDLVLIPIVIFGALTLLGIRDLTQKGHAVLRNYPISAHLRFLLEEIRPEMAASMIPWLTHAE